MEFVYDRTAEDVANRTKKGFINADDLNRIESNLKTLYEMLSAGDPETKSWEIGGLPRFSDYKRIRENLQTLKDEFPELITSETPLTPEQPLNTYEKWNDIEKILFDIDRLYEGIGSDMAYCDNDIYAGEGTGILL